MKRLQGRVAIVTGAASRIGLACARRFADEGAIVVGTDLAESTAWKQTAIGAVLLSHDGCPGTESRWRHACT